MEIVYRKLDELKPNPKNPRKVTKDAVEKLAQSIKDNPKFFEARPILLSDRTGDLIIIAGERRSEAARILGMESVPTILISGLTEAQEDAIGSEFELIWSKQKHKRRMLRHDWFGFLSSQNQQDARNRKHPTQKLVTLLVDILQQWGKDAKTVIDLYGGSGSTLIAAEQIDKECLIMEIDPHYCDVIIDRWEQYTGQKAEKISA